MIPVIKKIAYCLRDHPGTGRARLLDCQEFLGKVEELVLLVYLVQSENEDLLICFEIFFQFCNKLRIYRNHKKFPGTTR